MLKHSLEEVECRLNLREEEGGRGGDRERERGKVPPRWQVMNFSFSLEGDLGKL